MFVSRISQAIPVLFFVACFNFIMLRAAPGDPAAIQAGIGATDAQISTVRGQLGLDRPVVVQLGIWLRGLIRGDLGRSYITSESVMSTIAHSVAPTLQLALCTLVLVAIVGIPLGMLAALRKGGVADPVIRTFSLVGAAVPSLVLGVLLVLVFGWWFPGILPYQGYASIVSDPVEGVRHTLLPALALAAGPIGIVTRLTRASMIEVLGQEYVTAARALGVNRRELIWRDALKNALLPVLTVLGVIVGYLLSGTVVVESIFGIHGLGRTLIEAFGQRDYPVAVGVIMVTAVTFLAVNLVTDLLYGVLNPRIRANLGGSSS